VEKLDNPALRDKPLLIGGDPAARGVVSTASYEARRFGCHSAMPMAAAIRLCPTAIVLPVRGERYREVSEQVFEILGRFTPQIEPLSIDEAFLDVTGSERLFGPGMEIARSIKKAIRDELGLTASAGVAPNKFLAKLASDLEKPDGLVEITTANAQSVLDALPVTKLWGAGAATAGQFERLNLRTIGQLRRADPRLITRAFGQAGEHFLRLARGEDDRPVMPDSQARSIGQEQTFAVDVTELAELRRVLLQQVEQVSRRLRKHALRARTVTLKLRTGDFTTRTRSSTLPAPTDSTEEIWKTAQGLLTAWADRQFGALRLLGMSVSQLTEARGGQLELFPDAGKLKRRRLDGALDRIAERFGNGAIRRGQDDRKPRRP